MYFDKDVNWEKLSSLKTGLTKDAAGFDAKKTRLKVQKQETFIEDRIVRYTLRPFDTRWCYYSSVNPLWNSCRPNLWPQVWKGNSFFMTRPAAVSDPEGMPFHFTTLLGDNDFQRGHSYYFPVLIRLESNAPETQADFLDQVDVINGQVISANLSEKARAYLAELGITNPDENIDTAALIWWHTLAIGYSPQYLNEHEDGVQSAWPRIPLPNNSDLLSASADLGQQIADLLNTEVSVSGVTSGSIRDELRSLGLQLGNDLSITARWGYKDSRGAIMPGSGDARERNYTPEELALIEQGASQFSLELDDALALLGDTTFDLYLNDSTYWSNIPTNVYEFVIGGYQVIKKWLSYRNENVLGRGLNSKESMEVTHMIRRITSLILLQPELNANYRNVVTNTHIWPE